MLQPSLLNSSDKLVRLEMQDTAGEAEMNS